jgi:hypothetical protein
VNGIINIRLFFHRQRQLARFLCTDIYTYAHIYMYVCMYAYTDCLYFFVIFLVLFWSGVKMKDGESARNNSSGATEQTTSSTTSTSTPTSTTHSTMDNESRQHRSHFHPAISLNTTANTTRAHLPVTMGNHSVSNYNKIGGGNRRTNFPTIVRVVDSQ